MNVLEFTLEKTAHTWSYTNNIWQCLHRNVVLEKINQLFPGQQWIGLLPDPEIVLLNLPEHNMTPQQCQKILPAMLSSQLLYPLDFYHYQLNSDASTILLIEKSVWQSWQQNFVTAEINLEKLLPIFLALPPPQANERGCVYRQDSNAHVRISAKQGFVIANPHLQDLEIVNENLPAGYAEHAEKDLDYREILEWDHAELVSPVNALQVTVPKILAITERTQKFWRKTSGYLFGIWIFVAIFTWIFQIYSIHAQEVRVQQQIHTLYSLYFPQAKSLTAPELRFKRLWQKTAAERSQFFLKLSSLISRLKKNNAKILLLSYINNKMIVCFLHAKSSLTTDNAQTEPMRNLNRKCREVI